MPSPIAHSAIGYVVYRIYGKQTPYLNKSLFGVLPRLLLITMVLSLLPDLDSIPGIVLGDFGRYHNSATHSFIVGFLVSLIIAAIVWLKLRKNFWIWFFIPFFCYQAHVLMDMFTFGRGVMAFWPLTSMRFKSPVYLFYGLHWSDGLFSPRHILTIITELIFVLILYGSFHVLMRVNNKTSLTLHKPGQIIED